VSDPLAVHVNRTELHGLEVPNSFEVTGSFVVEITNHGEPLHVHLHLDDALSEVARLEASNHHVDAESTRRVEVAVDPREAVRGKLKVVTAYGATTRYIDLVVDRPEREKDPVQVDESLNKPKPRQSPGPSGGGPSGGGPNESTGGLLVERPELAVLAFGGVALAVAVLAAVVLQNVIVVLGSLVVVAGVLVAAALLLR